MLLPFTSLTGMMDILDWATISQDLMCVYQSITPRILAIFTNTENSPLFSHYHFVEDNLNILEVFKTSNNGWLGTTTSSITLQQAYILDQIICI